MNSDILFHLERTCSFVNMIAGWDEIEIFVLSKGSECFTQIFTHITVEVSRSFPFIVEMNFSGEPDLAFLIFFFFYFQFAVADFRLYQV